MRVLVVHGSEYGGTAGLGRMIAEAFVARGVQADVGDAADVDDLTWYDVVIVGGALYNDKWHHDARDFVRRHAETLRSMPVWFFSSGPLDDSARSGGIAPVDGVRRLARDVDVMGHMTFGGMLSAENVTLLDTLRHRHPGDWRSPEQVQEWVGRILARLGAHPTPAPVEVAPPLESDDDAGLRLIGE